MYLCWSSEAERAEQKNNIYSSDSTAEPDVQLNKIILMAELINTR